MRDKTIAGAMIVLLCCIATASELTVVDTSTGKKYKIELPAEISGTITEVTEPTPPPPPPPPPPPGNGIPEPDTRGNIVLRKAGTYELTKDLVNRVYIAGPDIELRLNGHSIRTDATQAVKEYVSWRDGNIYGQLPRADRFTLRGPGLVESMKQDAIHLYDGFNLTIANVHAICHGDDMACIRTSNGVTVKDCLLVSHMARTANRHQLPPIVRADWGATQLEGCALIGGQVGILARTGSVIRNNFFSQSGIDTNCYAIAIDKHDSILVEGNLIVQNNGRGVLINGGTGKDTDRGCMIRNNVIFAREKPNQEFGSALNANCIRVRYDARNNTATENICLAVGGAPYTGGTGLYLSNEPGVTNTFVKNVFQGIVNGETKIGRTYGKAVTLETQGDWRNGQPLYNDDIINDNVFRSNHIGLSCSGVDGYEHGAHMANPLTGNEFILEDGRAILDRFVTAARARFTSLGIAYPEAQQRLDEVIESFAAYTDLGLQQFRYDVWTEMTWRTPVNVTVKGSGSEVKTRDEDGINVRRSEFPGYPVNIKIEN